MCSGCVSTRAQDGQNAHRARHAQSPGADRPTHVEPPVAGGRERVVHRDGLAAWSTAAASRSSAWSASSCACDADAFSDGHDVVACSILHRHEDDSAWQELPMAALGNDVFAGEFRVTRLGRHLYTVQRLARSLRVVATRPREAHRRGPGRHRRPRDRQAPRAGRCRARRRSRIERALEAAAAKLADPRDGGAHALAEPLETLMRRVAERELRGRAAGAARGHRRPRARALLGLVRAVPALGQRRRSRRHGTFADVEARLPYVASMGFDVLYLPPIHPIGRAHRKGPNNAEASAARRPRQPVGDRRAPRAATRRSTPSSARSPTSTGWSRGAAAHGLEIALDLAFQCAPDHPWVTEHPEWFRHRPDGTIQYAENPPKRYQDIYPLEFESRGLAGAVGRRCSTSCASGSATACASSASTTRTRSRSRSGSG